MKPQAYWLTLLRNARAGLLSYRYGPHSFRPAMVSRWLGEAALAKRILRRGYHCG